MHQKTYSVHFQRGSNVELATFSYTLDTNNHNYTINNIDSIYHIELPIATTHIPTINYTLVDTRSIATIIENTHPSTRVDDTISLHIVGWDNLQEKTYHFIFSVELSTEALLTDLRVDNETIENFHPDTLHYAIEYEYGYSIIPIITASASQADATIDYQQITEFPQQAIIQCLPLIEDAYNPMEKLFTNIEIASSGLSVTLIELITVLRITSSFPSF
mgnify:CR=1 FL=1